MEPRIDLLSSESRLAHIPQKLGHLLQIERFDVNHGYSFTMRQMKKPSVPWR